jgi:hypothetical protein
MKMEEIKSIQMYESVLSLNKRLKSGSSKLTELRTPEELADLISRLDGMLVAWVLEN